MTATALPLSLRTASLTLILTHALASLPSSRPGPFSTSLHASLTRLFLLAILLLAVVRLSWGAFLPHSRAAYLLCAGAHVLEALWLTGDWLAFDGQRKKPQVATGLLGLIAALPCIMLLRSSAYVGGARATVTGERKRR